MQFSTTADIAAPIDHVFAQARDFDTFERRALREGVTITRQPPGDVVVGTTWAITALFRGRKRQFTATLTDCDAPDGYRVTTIADGLLFVAQCNLIALSPQLTRISMVIDVSAKTIGARVLLQSLKLVKARLSAQFETRMQSYATTIEDSYRSKV